MLEIVSLIDSCTRQSAQKGLHNVDHDICAWTRHSMSGLENKHSLKLSSPVIIILKGTEAKYHPH